MKKKLVMSLICMILLVSGCDKRTKISGTITVDKDEPNPSVSYKTSKIEATDSSSSATELTTLSETINQTEYANSLVKLVEKYSEFSEDGSIWYVDTLAPKAFDLPELKDFVFSESVGVEERMLTILNETVLPYIQVEKDGMPYYEDSQTGEITLPYTYWIVKRSTIHPDDRTYTYDENEPGCSLSVLYYEYSDNNFIYNGDPKKNANREHQYSIKDNENGFESTCNWDEKGENDRWLIKKTISGSGSETVECSIFHYDRECNNCYIFEISCWSCGKNKLSNNECTWLTKCIGLVDETIPINDILLTL